MIQLLLHLLGDYVLQSDWMAINKAKRSVPCLVHVTLYTLPFWFITHSPVALAIIFGTHFVLDRFSLAKYLIWAKNHLNPKFTYYVFDLCKVTGYRDAPLDGGFGGVVAAHCGIRPYFITLWLYIITDNGLHLACNAFALWITA